MPFSLFTTITPAHAQDFSTLGLSELTKEINAWNPGVQHELGNRYYSGKDVEQDYGKAVECYTKAAVLGNCASQYMLGYCYYMGYGVAKNFTNAADQFTRSAAQGYKLAQYMLAECYRYGKGITKNTSRAIYWYEKASENGYDNADAALGWLSTTRSNTTRLFLSSKNT